LSPGGDVIAQPAARSAAAPEPMSSSTTPAVSVVIPVYNRPEPVTRAIQSVLAQTVQDFEIIVVDDGSTDAVAAAVASIPDPRLRLIRHERNKGGSAARNTGIRASSAPFVAFLDSDDEWMPTKLARQLDLFARSDERLGLVYSGTERTHRDGDVQIYIPSRHANLAHELLTVNVVGETSVGMVRRSVLDATGGFDETLPSSQDLDLWLRICQQFSADFIPEPLVKVAKGSDRGRITANVSGMTRGRDLFCAKHRERLVQDGVLHQYLRDSGWVYLREVRDARLARRSYLESLKAGPFAPLTYVMYLAAWLPMSWLDRVASWKHRLAHARRGRSRAGVSGQSAPGTLQG
jgi:glycosyltransferase involved in cell wall biosynthesis